ncbi:4Fe-4S binding domain containing protein [Entamoeba histolytica HM-3:IMSS]|uniref:4Fe-4S binding domain containing protein n=1 Tax=Entamoeba histolytica HM-3:IMSS TaxID=885315 RepID=M7X7A1_ENTHI|nr:4Fe-4S binding domain containing protein [Entamoeba histolytica HM-3:IMSS]
MGKITIVNIDDCVACGACSGTCPQSVLEEFLKLNKS